MCVYRHPLQGGGQVIMTPQTDEARCTDRGVESAFALAQKQRGDTRHGKMSLMKVSTRKRSVCVCVCVCVRGECVCVCEDVGLCLQV